MPTNIDSEKMEDIKNSDETWVVDFWAEWCGPCKKLAPRFEEVSEELDSVNFGKVDMEENQQIGTSEGIRALPTLVIYSDGEEVARKSGLMKKEELKNWIQEKA
ncbi:MAG: thioredoxin [Nanohaloarchaea archaeon]|nr:thioredoxin [Candidatus Nanohaloarchaea archaeon]